MIVLKNPGLLEIDLITTMGAHVKETTSHIGQFGTGMKYAIAVLLREKIPFDLFIGENQYEFYTEKKTIRGKEFELCYMSGPFDKTPLGFTTEFGKNWESWQAYRELFTNAVLDESGGGVYHGKKESAPQPEDGFTTFRIHGSINTNGVFLSETSKKIIFENSNVEIYEGVSDYLYYQGIRARDLHKRSMYTYNIKHRCNLTEDRQLAYDFQVHRFIAGAIAEMGEDNKSLIGDILGSDEKYFESRLDFTDADESKPSETFIEVHQSLPSEKRNSTSSSFIRSHSAPAQKTKSEKRNEFIAGIESLCCDFDGDYVIEVEDDRGIVVKFTGEIFEKGE